MRREGPWKAVAEAARSAAKRIILAAVVRVVSAARFVPAARLTVWEYHSTNRSNSHSLAAA